MTTPRLDLPEMADGEGSGYTTFNDLTRILDATVNPVAQSSTVTDPPGSPAEGQCWYVPAGATGAWAGNVNTLAQWYESAWYFYTLPTGAYIFVEDTATPGVIGDDGTISVT